MKPKLTKVAENQYNNVIHEAGQGDRVYGGQLVSDAVFAAYMTVDGDRYLHSMHCYYAKFGQMHIPIHYEVDRIRDGRTFSNRHVIARQNGDVILLVDCSFQKVDFTSAFRLNPLFPSDIPGPESLQSHFVPEVSPASAYNLLRTLINNPIFTSRFDIRPVLQGIHLPKMTTAGPKHQIFLWIRQYADDIDNRIDLHCTAVWLCDMGLVVCGLLTVDVTKTADHASLDHTMWLHEYQFSMNDWMLYEMETRINTNERSLIFGRLWSRDGRLILSTAQEGLLRMQRAKL